MMDGRDHGSDIRCNRRLFFVRAATADDDVSANSFDDGQHLGAIVHRVEAKSPHFGTNSLLDLRAPMSVLLHRRPLSQSSSTLRRHVGLVEYANSPCGKPERAGLATTTSRESAR